MIKTEYFNTYSLGDMVYLLHHETDAMKLIKNSRTFVTNGNDVSIVFRTDCNVNVDRFKMLVSFAQGTDQATTHKTELSTKNTPKQGQTSHRPF